MIVSFSMSNFLSFDYTSKDVPCISMNASKPRNKIDHILTNTDLLKSSVMFGGNGSGKSNIVKGLRFLKRIITTDWVPSPFGEYYCKNNPDNKTKPIRFKIEFIKEHGEKDLSDVIDWYLNRSWTAPDDVQRSYDENAPIHYVYELVLQYVSDALPYNIAFESCYTVEYGRKKEQFNYKNELTAKEIASSTKESSDLYRMTSELDDLKKEEVLTVNKINETEKSLITIKNKISDINKMIHRPVDDSTSKQYLDEMEDRDREISERRESLTLEIRRLENKMMDLGDTRDKLALKIAQVEKQISYDSKNDEAIDELAENRETIVKLKERMMDAIEQSKEIEYLLFSKMKELSEVNKMIHGALAGEIDIETGSFDLDREKALWIQREDLKRELDSLEKNLKTLKDKQREIGVTVFKTEAQINDLKAHISNKKSLKDRIKTVPEVRISEIDDKKRYEKPQIWMVACAKHDILDWFSNTLVLVDIRDKVLPIGGFEQLKRINDLLPYFDAHIKGLTYREVDKEENLGGIIDRLDKSEVRSFFNYARSNEGIGSSFAKIVSDGVNFYELVCHNSSFRMRKLMTVHKDDSIHELYEESDGTRRLIELASVLVEPEDNKVYVIDELDRRLHPLITMNFIKMFYKMRSEKVQLIITTHETRLATTDIFRLDEICLVDHDRQGTMVTRAKDALKVYDRPFEELYLEGFLLHGAPRIKPSSE